MRGDTFVGIFGILLLYVINVNAMPFDELTSLESSTLEPLTPEPSTLDPSTLEPSTLEPSTLEPSTLEPSTLEPSTLEPSTTVEPETTEAVEIDTTLEPPVLCDEGVEFLPAPKCDEFYMCLYGIGILKSCPKGLYWDSTLNVCSWDSQYCENGLPGPSESVCSSGDLFVPLESDCSKYIQCVFDFGIEMSCPPGLLWNQPLQTCDYECKL